MLLQSDALAHMAERFRRDGNITVRPTLDVVGGIKQPEITVKGDSMQNIHDKEQFREANQEINSQEAQKVQNLDRAEKEKESFIDKLDKASDLWEKVQDLNEFINDDIKELVKNEEDLNILSEMVLEHGMENIDSKAMEAFKDLAIDVMKETMSNNGLEFATLMNDTVRVCGKFEKQLSHKQEMENER